jgi:putative aldouronate transport system permease protein
MVRPGAWRFPSVFTLLKGFFLVLTVLMVVYPMIYMLAVSFSGNMPVMRNEVWILPKEPTLNVYKLVFRDQRILRSYLNTIEYVVIGTALSLSVTTCAAYALSKKTKLVMYRFFSVLVLIPIFFGGGMIPTYLTVKLFGMINTLWAVVIPGAVSCWNLLIMRSFFVAFPREVEESGMIDGLNDIGVLARLVLPLSTAVLATIGLFYAVGLWNAFFGPFLYLDDPKKHPLQIVLRDIVLQGSSYDMKFAQASRSDFVVGDTLKYATIIVSMAPIIAVYPFLQKYFVKGVMLGSLKG